MADTAEFEICGLHYILRRSLEARRGMATFQLCDEDFRTVPIRFSAKSRDDLFAKLEARIGMPLTIDVRDQIRAAFAPFGEADGLAHRITHLITKPAPGLSAAG